MGPTPPPAPLAEAIEGLSDAARAWLDGPLAFLQGALNRSVQPGYGTDQAATDAAGYWLRAGQAWWGGMNAVVDAIAVLALPPGDHMRFDVPIDPMPVPATVLVTNKVWTWLLATEPPDVTIQPEAPLVPAGATSVLLRVTPLTVEPSWTVTLALTPLGSATPVTTTVTVDASTELPPNGP